MQRCNIQRNFSLFVSAVMNERPLFQRFSHWDVNFKQNLFFLANSLFIHLSRINFCSSIIFSRGIYFLKNLFFKKVVTPSFDKIKSFSSKIAVFCLSIRIHIMLCQLTPMGLPTNPAPGVS